MHTQSQIEYNFNISKAVVIVMINQSDMENVPSTSSGAWRL